MSNFIDVINSDLSKLDSRYRHHALDVAKKLNQYIKNGGQNPENALENLLTFYRTFPNVQNAMRDVFSKSLDKYYRTH
jgi:hypothetical protein